MKLNDYLKGMFEEERKYSEECQRLDALKSHMRNSLGLDEYWKWLDTQEKPSYPFTHGQAKALRAIAYCELDELEMRDFLWDDEIHDFVDVLRNGGLHTFVLTNKSTALMDNIHGYVNEGCKLVGLCEVEKADRWNGTEVLRGIRFEL